MEWNWADIAGYAASFFLIISFLIKDMKWLRAINMIGCICFVVYGIMIDSIPVIFPNAIICLTQIYHLYKMSKKNVQ